MLYILITFQILGKLFIIKDYHLIISCTDIYIYIYIYTYVNSIVL